MSGFRKTVLDWLISIFPYGDLGGVVCIIDNLELLQTSDSARKKLEQLRDKLFSYSGIRCVLCGSLGIVSGILSSPRLEGRLDTPITIKGIKCEYAPDVLTSRIKAFSLDLEKVYLPIEIHDFVRLYNILNQNIRNTLDYAHKYCLWIADEGEIPENNEKKQLQFDKWLSNLSHKTLSTLKSQMGQRPLKLLYNVGKDFGGSFSLGDYTDLDFKSIAAMRPHINTLEKFGLLTRYPDEDDKRRKTINITAKGWFIYYSQRL